MKDTKNNINNDNKFYYKNCINNTQSNITNLLFNTPFGEIILNDELLFYHNITKNIFGYYAIQIGLPELDLLKHNKIKNKYKLDIDLKCDYINLPFENNSIDLILCPHILETNKNFHLIIKELYRILIPNGRLIISNFNFHSLFNLYHYFYLKKHKRDNQTSNKIHKLNIIKNTLIQEKFTIIGGKFLNYLPPINNHRLLKNIFWLNKVGDRWFPLNANIYAIITTKQKITVNLLQNNTLKQHNNNTQTVNLANNSIQQTVD